MTSSESDEDHFSAPAKEQEFSAVLFDMDGTIIDSTDAVIKYWHDQGRKIGVDGDTILHTGHGRRSIDVLKKWAPDRADWDYVKQAEGQIPVIWGKDAVEIPGSRLLLARLEAIGASWAIVTSGTSNLLNAWLKIMKLPPPKCMVTAEDVSTGKPDPQCYQLGAKRLSGGNEQLDHSQILVVEDAPAGIAAGKAAGYKVIAVATTHNTTQLRKTGADWIVKDLRSVSVTHFNKTSAKVTIEITNALTT